MAIQEQSKTKMIKQSAKDALAARIKEAEERQILQQKEQVERDRQYRIRKLTEKRLEGHREAFQYFVDKWFPISTHDLPKEERRELEILVHRKVLQRIAGWAIFNLSATATAVTLWQFALPLAGTGLGVAVSVLALTIPAASILFSYYKYERKNYIAYRFRFRYHSNFLLGRKYAIAAAKEAAQKQEGEHARVVYANIDDIGQIH